MNQINRITEERTRQFASAAYDSNTTDDLCAALRMDEADPADLSAHEIDAEQWREAITAALLERGEDEGLVLCESSDGWSLHEAGSTDEQIACGDAEPLISGPWIRSVRP